MKWLSIDFETSNPDRISACSLGVTVIDDQRITDSHQWYLRPPVLDFWPEFVQIHGIDEQLVKNEPQFDALWPKISEWFSGRILVAHNATFDMKVLHALFKHFAISSPELSFACTLLMSRRAFPDLKKYGLEWLCDHFDIKIDHHDALSDSKACAQILLKIFDKYGTDDLSILHDKFMLVPGNLDSNSYNQIRNLSSTHTKNAYYQIKGADYKVEVEDLDPEHPMFRKIFAFTGTLTSMNRADAMKAVIDRGGDVASGVNKKIDYLVLGIQDFRRLLDGKTSSKMRKTDSLIEQGYSIEIIPEDDFLKML